MNPTLKTCFKCGVKKPRCDYYAHPKMADGLLGKCKECAKTDTTTRRILHPDLVRSYDRKRSILPHRKALRDKINKAYPTRQKRAAYSALQAAKDGRLLKTPCVICGTVKVEGHHPDYSRPLHVIYLCIPHHRQLHAGRFSLIPTLTHE